MWTVPNVVALLVAALVSGHVPPTQANMHLHMQTPCTHTHTHTHTHTTFIHKCRHSLISMLEVYHGHVFSMPTLTTYVPEECEPVLVPSLAGAPIPQAQVRSLCSSLSLPGLKHVTWPWCSQVIPMKKVVHVPSFPWLHIVLTPSRSQVWTGTWQESRSLALSVSSPPQSSCGTKALQTELSKCWVA